MAIAQHDVVETTLGSAPKTTDPQERVDVVFVEPDGLERRVPAFVRRGEWKVRYSSAVLGHHRYHAETDVTLGEREGEIEVDAGEKSDGTNPHGALRVASDRRHLQHTDGTPFLWLADTWWDGFTRRLSTDDFRRLAAQRAEQGFSVVQIVAGLYPEMAPFAPEGESASGWAWHEGFTAPNLAWFDEADERVTELVNHGLVPCIIGAWGYYLQYMSVKQMLRHWRELMARWGAYPVVWCLAGEMPALGYDQMLAAVSKFEPEGMKPRELVPLLLRQLSLKLRHRGRGDVGFPDSSAIATMLGVGPAVADQVKRWNEVARGVRAIEPFGRPITVHSQPNWPPYELLEDLDLADFWLLQTGHSATYSLAPSVNQVVHALAQTPAKPVLVGEVCYEGILGSSWHEIQRFLFWSHLLSGTAGHSYGAQGVWGFNTPEYPGGTGGRWSELTWQDAAALPGATHLGIGRQILMGLPWEQFDPHPEWVKPHHSARDRIQPYAAGVPGGPRVVYFPVPALVRNSLGFRTVRLEDLGTGAWVARFVNPRTGRPEPTFLVEPDAKGGVTLKDALAGPLPSKEDWVLVLRPATSAEGQMS